MKGAACEELCRFLTRSRYQRWWLFILSALDEGLSIDACCEPPYLQATYFWPQGSFVQIFHCGRRGWVEKARLFRISMTMACRAVAGVGARKILVSTHKGQSTHGQNTISFFVDIRPTTSHNGCDYHHWLSPLFLLFCRGYMARGKVWRRLGCLVGEVESREARNQARSHKYK